jgi:1-deoxy-D-xylulose-5-phosphate reductoisomerase
MTTKQLLILGSTGSIGTQTLDIVRHSNGAFGVAALSAARSWEKVLEQVLEFHPKVVAMADAEAGERLRPHLPPGTGLVLGPEAAEELATSVDYDLAMHGIVGSAGVRPSEAILKRGLPLALANKESLVVAGEPLMELSRSQNAPIIPVDSEHCAIFQCLHGESRPAVRRIFLTASGGPFRELPMEDFAQITPAQALKHPNWDMGPRITVGSATMVNKALEVIEAHHLYDLPASQIEVLVHPQSVVHSMVEFIDGSIIAQLGPPDMRLPIHYALHWPERAPSRFQGFQPELFKELNFTEIDRERFPAIELGFRCVDEGGDAGAVLNAADEVAVDAFLNGKIEFLDIVKLNRAQLDKRSAQAKSIDELLAVDLATRQSTLDQLNTQTTSS